MTPHSFDIDTAKEVVGDARTRTIEAKARADAENGTNDPPSMGLGSYWSQVSAEMDYKVYSEAHAKRVKRMQRTGDNVSIDHQQSRQWVDACKMNQTVDDGKK